jgi:hypothetical protein
MTFVVLAHMTTIAVLWVASVFLTVSYMVHQLKQNLPYTRCIKLLQSLGAASLAAVLAAARQQ